MLRAITLSVIIPIHNGEKFIEQAVESVQKQTLEVSSIELILVDDFSEDNSIDLCKKLQLKNSHIKLIINDANSGVAGARNLGITEAKNEFLSFLDQDDLWMPQKLETQVNLLKQFPENSYFLGMQEFFMDKIDILPKWFQSNWCNTPQKGFLFGTLLIRRSDFLRVGLLETSLRFCDDVDWFSRARAFGLSEIMSNQVLLKRRIHQNNASSKTIESNKELLRVIHKNLKAK